jgi:hypothetical protein
MTDDMLVVIVAVSLEKHCGVNGIQFSVRVAYGAHTSRLAEAWAGGS